MLYNKSQLPTLKGKTIFLETIDNHFYTGVLKDTTGIFIELVLPLKQCSEYVYKSAIRKISDSREDIKCPDGNHWIT